MSRYPSDECWETAAGGTSWITDDVVTVLDDSCLLSIRACARYADVPVPTIRMLIRTGQLPAMVSGLFTRVRLKDLQWWEDAYPAQREAAEPTRSFPALHATSSSTSTGSAIVTCVSTAKAPSND